MRVKVWSTEAIIRPGKGAEGVPNPRRELDETPRRLEESAEHKAAICAVVISTDGQWMASGCGAGTVKVWKLGNLERSVISASLHESAIRCLDFSRDSKTLASGSEDKTVRLWSLSNPWDTKLRREVARFQFPYAVRLVKFSPNDKVLAIVTDDGSLRLLRAAGVDEIDSGK
jgi:WD40 repeat protein